VALIAAALAQVREDSKEKLARAIGTPRAGEGTTALVSPLRLKRLVSAREPDDLLIAFRRAIAILGHTANVKDVARQLLLWTDERTADRARTLFTFDYHNAGDAAPDLKSA
jgi:CRISPR system Cascade subunit CasB